MIITDIDRQAMTSTITFKYEELRALSNLLFKVDKEKFLQNKEKKLYADIFTIVTLLDHGFIPDFELEHIIKLMEIYKNEVNKIAEENRKAGC